ncbi:MAG: hypothetical protein NHB32_06490 [Fischerella sp. CENA71]|nr:hypothetical protein [Fischerella sp. CENA71]
MDNPLYIVALPTIFLAWWLAQASHLNNLCVFCNVMLEQARVVHLCPRFITRLLSLNLNASFRLKDEAEILYKSLRRLRAIRK